MIAQRISVVVPRQFYASLYTEHTSDKFVTRTARNASGLEAILIIARVSKWGHNNRVK